MRALAAGKVPHALLFVGPAGVGKAACARALAAALNCETRPGLGCASCTACEKIEAGIHPDVIALAPEGAGNFIQADTIRGLIERLGYPPHEGAARVVILEDAERLHLSAANAFLKTLEEPPARTHFILVTAAPDQLPITIRSRCQRVRFVERARRERVEERRRRAAAVMAAARGGGWRQIVDVAGELAQAKDDLQATLELVAYWYRDAAAVAAGLPAERLMYPEEITTLREEAGRAGPAALARRAAAVLDAQTALIGFANPQLTIERMILALRE